MSRFWLTLLVLTGVGTIVADLLYDRYEITAVWERELFFAVYGFVGCIAIIWISKWMGKFWLLRGEEYYDRHRAPQPGEPAFEVNRSTEGSDA